MSLNIPVSIGELWDKYTILKIKELKINDATKLEHVKREIEYLFEHMKEYQFQNDDNFNDLFKINKELWDIEDNIREKERMQEFDDEFIELARSVYFTNDKRALIKKEINEEYNSLICEVKNYKKYA